MEVLPGENSRSPWKWGDNLFTGAKQELQREETTSMRNSAGFQTGHMTTASGYDFTRNVVSASNRAGGQFGFGQPVNKKITFAADWLTGKHGAGYFTPGVVLRLGRDHWICGLLNRNQVPVEIIFFCGGWLQLQLGGGSDVIFCLLP
jgi:hypothetical protein